MSIAIQSFITLLFYFVAGVVQLMRFFSKRELRRAYFFLLAFVAVLLHGELLYHWIDLSAGQNLTVFNMFSLSIWLVALFVLLASLFKPLEAAMLFILPLAILSIILVVALPSKFIIDTHANRIALFHIVFSIVTFAVLSMAALQALLLAVQERLLRYYPNGALINRLPPLEVMEKLLFQVVRLGFVLLSVLLASSLYFYHAILLDKAILVQKTVLVCAVWLVFAILLSGRYIRGWRGKMAIYCTLSGVVLLIIVYFGSKLLLEG